MPLVFAAFTPHPPFLVSTIGKSHAAAFSKTRAAFEYLAEEMYLAHPDIAVIITPHGPSYGGAFGVLGSPAFVTDFNKFGDAIIKRTFTNDLRFVSSLTEACKKEGISSSLIPYPTLDYGAAIPLMFLLDCLPRCSVVCIHPAPRLTPKDHIDFGYVLKGVAMQTNKRVAIIASGDLSHRLVTASPGGYHKDGAVFEKKIKEIISTHGTMGLLNLNPTVVSNAATCAWQPLLILFGVLGRMNATAAILAHESPYGVGHMTVFFNL